MMQQTYAELKKQIEELQEKAEAVRQTERVEVIGRMKEAIAVYDITAEELDLTSRRPSRQLTSSSDKAGGSRSRKDAKQLQVAYADDQGNSWAGRGPRPKWLKEAIDGGAKLEDFARK